MFIRDRSQIGGIERGGAEDDVNAGAVLAAPADFDGAGASLDDLPIFLQSDPVEIFVIKIELASAASDQFLTGIPGKAAQHVVDILNDTVADHADADRSNAQDALQPGFAGL